MKKKIEVTILVPAVPLALETNVKDESGERALMVAIEECTDAELRSLGRQWTEQLLLCAAKRRPVATATPPTPSGS